MPFDMRPFERPGAARQRAQEAWQTAVDAQARHDAEPTLSSAADVLESRYRYMAAADEAKEEVDTGMTDGQGAAVIAGWESDPDFERAPRTELRQIVEQQLSAPHLIELEGHDGS